MRLMNVPHMKQIQSLKKHEGIIISLVSGALQQCEGTLHIRFSEPLGHSWEMKRCRFFFRQVISLMALRLSQTIPAGTALNRPQSILLSHPLFYPRLFETERQE